MNPNKYISISNMKSFILFLIAIVKTIHCLDNGLALTPPMGWMNWQRFRCVVDCEKYPDDCISERLFKRIADAMEKEGYLAAGYNYVIVDDCWSAMERDNQDRLVADPIRFPSGMKALGDYLHSKGFKFGLYGDYGTLTCAGYPGSLNYMEIDAQTFASWGVDYVKLDGCNSDPDTYEKGYAEYGKYLNETGRPIVYSCSWPAYEEVNGIQSNYEALARTCNLWRNYYDIQDSYSTYKLIVNWFTENQDRLQPFSAPGHWNDPDMLLIGNFGLSLEQSKAQMTIWSLMAAPLIMSNDIGNIRPEFQEILLNKEAIAINQDTLGIQGLRKIRKNLIDAWTKPILPTKGGETSFGVGFISNRDDGILYPIEFTLKELGLNNTKGYKILDVFTGDEWIEKTKFSIRIPPTGAIFLRAVPL